MKLFLKNVLSQKIDSQCFMLSVICRKKKNIFFLKKKCTHRNPSLSPRKIIVGVTNPKIYYNYKETKTNHLFLQLLIL